MVTPETKRHLRVLNIEDSEDDALLLKRHLQRAGYDLRFARVDTLEAMTSALHAEKWDVCLVDYNMPQFNALAALEVLKDNHLDLPFIILSGAIGEDTAVSAMRAGAHDYMMKGNLARLIPAIERELQEAANRHKRKQAEKEVYRLNAELEQRVLERTAQFEATNRELENEIAERKRAEAQINGLNEKLEQRVLERTAQLEATNRELENEIAERKRAEAQREQLLASEQQARLEAEAANRSKDEFLATVSHELRTPLTAILGWSHLLRSGNLDTAATARAVETIERNARAQTQLIEDILDISRIVTGKLRLDVTAVELAPVIEAVIDSVRPAAQARSVQLQTKLDRRAGAVSGDPDRLQQVVWNLLTNAIKFTPNQGQVDVSLERSENSHVRIVVQDSGQGISPEFLPYVFDRFRQEDGTSTRTHGGLGLGLAIVRHLAEMHGGTVGADSRGEGHGSTFTVTLPLLAIEGVQAGPEVQQSALAETARASAAIEKSDLLQGLRVLVVDDEEDTCELLAIVLKRSGAEVTVAGSAAEAFEMVKQIKPDVLVSDIGMPDMDGHELIRKVRELPSEEGGQIPAAALTAYAGVGDRMRSLLAGFQLHLPKPVEPAELVAVVASLAGRTANV